MADFIVLKRPGPPSREVLVNLDEILMGSTRTEQRIGSLIRQGPSRKFRRGLCDRNPSNTNGSLRATRSRQSLRFIAPLATKSTADRSLKSLRARAPPDGCACRDSPDLRAVLAAHVALQFVDWCCLRPAHDIQGDGLVRIAAEAPDFEIKKFSVEGPPSVGDGCAGPL